MKTKNLLLGFASLSLLLTGCATNESKQPVTYYQPQPTGHMQTINIVDSSERIKLDTRLSGADMLALAENITNSMLKSPLFTKAKKKPRIIVGQLLQNTHDENLSIADIQNHIEETLLNSGAVRLVDRSATNFDYIMKTEISDTVHRSRDGQKLVDYLMIVKLYNDEGEQVGIWKDMLTFHKTR